MNKNILIVGASGLVGSQIFKNLKKDNNCLVLLGRKRLSSENNTEQIISDFDNLENLENNFKIDEVYVAIGHKLNLSELIYIKKINRDDFVKVDLKYIKKVAEFAKRCGAKSVGLISAIGANASSINTYLKVKGKIESEIKLMNFEKIVIARPSHLLGKRSIDKTQIIVKLFEKITNFFGFMMIGPLQKFKNVEASKVAKAIISKMNSSEKGLHILDFKNFKNF